MFLYEPKILNKFDTIAVPPFYLFRPLLGLSFFYSDLLGNIIYNVTYFPTCNIYVNDNYGISTFSYLYAIIEPCTFVKCVTNVL